MMIVNMDKIVTTYNELNPDGHWFSKGTMRYFNCRLSKHGYAMGDNYYFITSEKCLNDNRKYTIRSLNRNNGDISTIGEFNEMTRNEARKELSKLLNCKVKDL